MPTMPLTKAVLLAGGGGTRLWPLSRARRPKQFLALGPGGSLLQQAWQRLRLALPAADCCVCAPRAFREAVLEQLPELAPERFIAEPAARGTGPAGAYAAGWLRRRFGEQVTVVTVAADLWVADDAAFAAALGRLVAAVGD